MKKFLVKSLHRAFGAYRLATEIRPKMLYLVDLTMHAIAIAMYDIFLAAEKGYINKLYVLAIGERKDSGAGEKIELLAKRYSIDVRVDFIEEKLSCTDILHRVRVLRRIALQHIEENIRENKPQYIVIPLPRDYVIAATIASYMSLLPHYAVDLLPSFTINDYMKTINPFYNVLVEDIAAYATTMETALTMSGDNSTLHNASIEKSVYQLLLRTTWRRGGELLYSFPKSHELLATTTSKTSYGRCKLCYGIETINVLERNNGVCRTCRKTLP